MSCPNFKRVNARNYYVVSDETTYYDEEQGKEVPRIKDNDDYDFDIECARQNGIEKGYTPYNGKQPYNRNMDASLIMEKDEWSAFGKKSLEAAFNQFNFQIEIYVRGGHYCGMNYDWDIKVSNNYDGSSCSITDFDSVKTMIDFMADDWTQEAADPWYGWNVGLATIQKKNFKKWLAKMIRKYSNEADSMCEYICDETLVCGGIFSNGEAIYYKADSLKGKVCNVEAA